MAAKAFEKAVKANPSNWWYGIQLISVLSSKEKYGEAIEEAMALKKQFPEKEEVYNMLSALYKVTGDYQKAIENLDELEKISGVNEYLSFQKFQLYSVLKKDKKAMDEVDKLITKYPSETRYQVLKGDALLDQKKEDLAYQIYQKVHG